METSQPLTIESFSYSWLINQNPSLDKIFNDNKEESTDSFVNSPRFHEESQDFHFQIPFSSPNLVHADEIFFNGHIIPRSLNQIRIYSTPATPLVHFPSKNPSKFPKIYGQLIVNLRVSSKRILRKCFSFLVPRKSTKIVDSSANSVCLSSFVLRNEKTNKKIECDKTTFRRTKSWSPNSTSGSRFPCSKNKSCDYNETSVHEAIVHCKRSFVVAKLNACCRNEKIDGLRDRDNYKLHKKLIPEMKNLLLSEIEKSFVQGLLVVHMMVTVDDEHKDWSGKRACSMMELYCYICGNFGDLAHFKL
ncbi:hypothetical protein LXL04_010747 [Taraxacum kok-saghyz]